MGLESRHIKIKNWERPEKPMKLTEAISLINRIAKNWLNEKINNKDNKSN
ncbi:unnamed protein product [marine sediment metagenome]|uniref:Uncharacterized protein n=1 Tax=marine sediment metagenome TaxID=412755 RepID=X0S5Q1_9ZZZZ